MPGTVPSTITISATTASSVHVHATTKTRGASSTRWGRYRADLTAACPRLGPAIQTMTDAQVACIYLHDFGEEDTRLSYAGIALVFGVTKSAVQGHCERGRKRLRAVVLPAPAAEQPASGSRVACAVCDTPWLPCVTCLERFVMSPDVQLTVRQTRTGKPTMRRLKRAVDATQIAARGIRGAHDLEHFAKHRNHIDHDPNGGAINTARTIPLPD